MCCTLVSLPPFLDCIYLLLVTLTNILLSPFPTFSIFQFPP